MDWIYDELFDGSRVWVVTIVDNVGRVSPGIWAGRQAKATNAVTALRASVAEFVYPKCIKLDNGSQFTSKEMNLSAYADGVVLKFSVARI